MTAASILARRGARRDLRLRELLFRASLLAGVAVGIVALIAAGVLAALWSPRLP